MVGAVVASSWPAVGAPRPDVHAGQILRQSRHVQARRETRRRSSLVRHARRGGAGHLQRGHPARGREARQQRVVKVAAQLHVLRAHVLLQLGAVRVVDLLVHRLLLHDLAGDVQGPARALLVQARGPVGRLDARIQAAVFAPGGGNERTVGCQQSYILGTCLSRSTYRSWFSSLVRLLAAASEPGLGEGGLGDICGVRLSKYSKVQNKKIICRRRLHGHEQSQVK